MNHAQRASAAYRTASMTVPPLHAVVMLYDGVLVRVRNAGLAAEQGDWARQFDEITLAVDLLRGLLSALDYDRGGDVARRLQQTYEANMKALMRSVGRQEALEMSRRIEDGLRQLRNAWAEIAGVPVNPSPRAQQPG